MPYRSNWCCVTYSSRDEWCGPSKSAPVGGGSQSFRYTVNNKQGREQRLFSPRVASQSQHSGHKLTAYRHRLPSRPCGVAHHGMCPGACKGLIYNNHDKNTTTTQNTTCSQVGFHCDRLPGGWREAERRSPHWPSGSALRGLRNAKVETGTLVKPSMTDAPRVVRGAGKGAQWLSDRATKRGLPVRIAGLDSEGDYTTF